MITVDGCGCLIDLDLAQDQDDGGTQQGIRTVSCEFWKGSWAPCQLIPCIKGHMAIYVNPVTL